MGLLPLNICQAIAREEGFYASTNSRSARNNNPGDLEYGVFAKAYGADRIEYADGHLVPRFAHFPSTLVGFGAMKQLLLRHYQGMTIEQMINKYAPPVENATYSYVKNVCNWTGLTADTVIDTHLG